MAKIRIFTIEQLNQFTRDKADRNFDNRIDLERSEKCEHDHIYWDISVGAINKDGFPFMKIHEIDSRRRNVYASQIEMLACEWSWMMQYPHARILTEASVILPTCGEILCCNPNHIKMFDKETLKVTKIKSDLINARRT